jgi:hypothetical protein
MKTNDLARVVDQPSERPRGSTASGNVRTGTAMMKPLMFALVLGWFVVNFSGQPVAGPFATLGDCQNMATYMAAHYTGVSTICQAR